MNHNIINNLYKNASYLKLLFVFIIILSPIQSNLHAEEKKDSIPRVSMGIGASFGYYDLIDDKEEYIKWKKGIGYGGGFIFERMFSDLFGIHSGIWFYKTIIEAEMRDDDDYHENNNSSEPDTSESDDVYNIVDFKSNYITIPFYLITSFDLNFISLNLLTGFNFTYITETFECEDTPTGTESENMSQHIGYSQLGVGGGLKIKFHITRFVDFFVAGIGEMYFTDYINDDDDNNNSNNGGGGDESITAYIYNYRITSGVLLRTF